MKKFLVSLMLLGSTQIVQAFPMNNDFSDSSGSSLAYVLDTVLAYEEHTFNCGVGFADHIRKKNRDFTRSCGRTTPSVFEMDNFGGLGNNLNRSMKMKADSLVSSLTTQYEKTSNSLENKIQQDDSGFGKLPNQDINTSAVSSHASLNDPRSSRQNNSHKDNIFKSKSGLAPDQENITRGGQAIPGQIVKSGDQNTRTRLTAAIWNSALMNISAINALSVINPVGFSLGTSHSVQGINNVSAPPTLTLIGLMLWIFSLSFKPLIWNVNEQ